MVVKLIVVKAMQFLSMVVNAESQYKHNYSVEYDCENRVASDN